MDELGFIEGGKMNMWLTEARNRLLAAGFVILDDVSSNGRTFTTVARRSRFELTKFGFSETFFEQPKSHGARLLLSWYGSVVRSATPDGPWKSRLAASR
jgi:hypothetical protein